MSDIYYTPILQVRNSEGEIKDILCLRGQSAWELAKESGYEGSIQDLSQALSLISGGFYWEWQNGTTMGPTAVLHFGENNYSIGAIPMATQAQSGIITTTDQSFKGTKTFLDSTTFQSDITLDKSNIHIIGTEQNNGKAFRISSTKIHADSGKNYSIGLHMGDGQTNRGLFDFTTDKWIVYTDINNNVRVQGKAKNVSWHKGRDGALICMNYADNTYRPALSIRTYEWETTEQDANGNDVTVLHGGDWAFGNHQNENLILTFTSTSNYNANKNSTKQITFLSSGGLELPGGLTVAGKTTCAGSLHVYGGTDTDDDGTGFGAQLSIGQTENTCLMMDTNEIVARSKGKLGDLFIRSAFEGHLEFRSPTTSHGNALTNVKARFQAEMPTIDSVKRYGPSINVQWDSSSDKNKNYSLCFTRWDPTHAACFVTRNNFSTGIDSGAYLGASSRRWTTIYSINAVSVSSDIRMKDIKSTTILEKLLKMYEGLTPIAYSLKNLTEYDNHDRIHVGLSSQEVELKLIENELTALDFGGFCKDPIYKKDTTEIIDYNYSLRYGEFHGLHIMKNHQQDARLAELEAKNQELENIVSNLKTQMELLKLAMGG